MATESTDNQPWTIQRLLTWTEQFLRSKQIESPRLEAQLLLAHVLRVPKIQLYVRSAEIPSEADRTTFRTLLKRRVEGMPVEYLIGVREFFLLPFRVTPAVLIPRPDTEVLVLEGLKRIRPLSAPRVLDLGTGSGAIAVVIAKQHAQARVTAVDISPEALEVAAGNAESNGVADRVQFLQGDLLAPVARDARFDLIVSNPPYIAHDEFPGLDREVRDFEPRLALDGGVDGLDFYRRLAVETIPFLAANGALMVEIGYTQDVLVRTILEHQGWQVEQTFSDGAGHPRVIAASRLQTA
ncbi:peptide chain release factor N(5)-glutamine methyltransferase [Tuwongella immobilis]|uniref:Release factor glutamine methyltransferase n=1 Tax=Tuwongella immobilis TaxID=692036 RepID=A0A6C2YM89_9BACT|nr:peptide chain release factor N(5)-glutamine methyltransferase [Tuwongella immobilis]VIP02339.1 modification family : Release factor glutamine methyltransferase OS=Singulisphaera acidiphila (strain ATCC BAA-1392 / DSM 18658 / VKM B-2454 / MOB10) GN=prmC PE=3 SV=1: Methyltransf_26 [Tuwongella immobilis]VTS01103.1 modification family : Release factor glutamine methyltransferase OS=Singulisphaera acidiphila (strain ATCC BAA-1392 / DSM 18658 / VKM B-2454 / MOB10) GN=prmC PE=3 SV=1: Methyltransf_26 